MVLVIGGLASGKRAYVRSLGFRDDEMDGRVDSELPVLYGLEELLRAGPLDEEQLAALTRRAVVVCCEVGQGVVPIDADERAWRERVGRTCAELAAQAERVVRMVCGIPLTIQNGRSEA